MKKLSFRPSPAMIVACVALFVALGGTGLAATYVVSSNSQVGPGTISGHNPPSGKHANIIGGSVNAMDLANGAATLGKLAPNSVNGSKVINGSLSASDTDTSSIQQRVTGSCPSGQAATSVTQAGGLSCATTDGGIARGVDALYGDGSDGDVTVSSNTTLSRDTYYHDLTIAPGTTLDPGGFRIFISGTLTFGDGAAIARNGNDGVFPSGGDRLPSGTLGGSGAGGNAPDNASADGEASSNSLGGSGGASNLSAGGSATPPSAAAGGTHVFDQALSALSGRSLDGTIVSGGGGGAEGDSGPGASGGGVIVVAARNIQLNGSAAITAKGGDASSDNGGGGGGGVVVVVTTAPEPGAMTLSVAGGAGGGSGAPGAPGSKLWLD